MDRKKDEFENSSLTQAEGRRENEF